MQVVKNASQRKQNQAGARDSGWEGRKGDTVSSEAPQQDSVLRTALCAAGAGCPGAPQGEGRCQCSRAAGLAGTGLVSALDMSSFRLFNSLVMCI